MSDRTFRLILDGKKGGLVKGSTPSSAAKKAYKKLSAETGKSSFKFELQETTKDSKKKVYGPYKANLVKDKIKVKMVGGGGNGNSLQTLPYTKNEKNELINKFLKIQELNDGYKYPSNFYERYSELSKKILGKENPTKNEVNKLLKNNY
jgi:hypothetical protein